MKTTVLDRIKLRMEELGMAPEAVSKKAGLDRSYLRGVFARNASPRIETLTKIACALEVTPEALLSGDIQQKQSVGRASFDDAIFDEMSAPIFDRINQRLDVLDLSPEAASKKAGLTRDYLRTLFRQQSSPTVKTLAKLATALETSPEWLMHGVGEMVNFSLKESAAVNGKAKKAAHEVTPVNMPVPSQSNMHKDLPVLGTAAGSHTNGVLSLEANIIEYVRRPPGVEAVKDAYAVYVEGDSMEPRYYAGDLIIAHPYRPPRIGDSVVVQFKRGEADYQEAIIGILHKRSGSKIEIEKLNPHNILNFDADNVIAIHRILSLNDLLGV